MTSFVEPSTPLGASSVHILEEMQKQRLTLDDGFGVIADDLDAVAEEFGFSLPDLDDSDDDDHGDGDGVNEGAVSEVDRR